MNKKMFLAAFLVALSAAFSLKAMQDNATYAVTTGGKITKLPQGQIMNQPNAQGPTYAVTTGGKVTRLPEGTMPRQPTTNRGPTHVVTTGGKVTILP